MYKISVPISANRITEENKIEYLSILKRCGISRVFLCGSMRLTDTLGEKKLAHIKSCIDFFTANDIETGVWISTLGHGIVLTHFSAQVEKPYTRLKTAQGDELSDTYCPLDENFRHEVAKAIARIASAGAKTVLLDDDLRMSQRGDGIGSITCCCERHLAYMSELSNSPVTLETVKNEVLRGKGGSLRNAWIKAQGDGLRQLCRDIRKEVDKVAPDTRVALCSAWCNWDVDGVDALELTKILAGNNPALLRLHGAPYWQKFGMYQSTIISVHELERMLASFCKDGEAELLTEGDVYPRPRYLIPASHLEAFDLMQRAQGEINGILKYMFDYTAPLGYEDGYLRAHERNFARAQELSAEMVGKSEGVRVYAYPHLFAKADIHPRDSERLSISPELVGAFIAENGIPTVYDGDGICACVFGANALNVPLSAISNGALIDSISAKELKRRGLDVGIDELLDEVTVNVGAESYADTVAVANSQTRIMTAKLNSRAVPISHATVNGITYVTSYRYENESGQKFFVLCFPAASSYGGIRVNYARQQSLKDAIEWISGKRLPVFCGKSPYLYTVLKRDNGKLRAAFFNCYEDKVLDPVIELDQAYESVRFIHGSGKLSGNKLLLEHDLAPYEYTAFELG